MESSSSFTAPSWTSNGVAPATAEEIKVASYLIISAAFDDFVPEVNTTVPPKLTYFLDEVNDGTVTDASLKFAKDLLDTTAKCPHYINPVHAVMASKHNLFLTMNVTYTWRAKITAAASDRTVPPNAKRKSSRLKNMLPTVARFILAPSRNVGGAHGGTRGGQAKQRTVFEESHYAPSHEVPPYGTGTVRYCTVLQYGTVKCIQ